MSRIRTTCTSQVCFFSELRDLPGRRSTPFSCPKRSGGRLEAGEVPGQHLGHQRVGLRRHAGQRHWAAPLPAVVGGRQVDVVPRDWL